MTKAAKIIVLLAATVFGGTQAVADEDTDAQDADACQGDIHRLCERFLPDEKQVAVCLVDQRSNLSRACAEVLARQGRD